MNKESQIIVLFHCYSGTLDNTGLIDEHVQFALASLKKKGYIDEENNCTASGKDAIYCLLDAL